MLRFPTKILELTAWGSCELVWFPTLHKLIMNLHFYSSCPFLNFCELQASIEIDFTGFLGTTKLRGYPNRSFTKVVRKSTESQALLDCVWFNKNTELERPPHSLRCRLQGHTPVTATVSYYTKAKQEKEKERRLQSKCYYFRNDSFFSRVKKEHRHFRKKYLAV